MQGEPVSLTLRDADDEESDAVLSQHMHRVDQVQHLPNTSSAEAQNPSWAVAMDCRGVSTQQYMPTASLVCHQLHGGTE